MNIIRIKRQKHHTEIETDLDLITFKQGDVFIVYSPALELSGYGTTLDEAEKSFKIVLSEFFQYVEEHNTWKENFKDWKQTSEHQLTTITPAVLQKLSEQRTYNFA